MLLYLIQYYRRITVWQTNQMQTESFLCYRNTTSFDKDYRADPHEVRFVWMDNEKPLKTN